MVVGSIPTRGTTKYTQRKVGTNTMANVTTIPPQQRLAENIRGLLQGDMVNGYTALSPKHYEESSVIRVKDARSPKMLVVTVTVTVAEE